MKNNVFRLVSFVLIALPLQFCSSPKTKALTAKNEAGSLNLVKKEAQHLTLYWIDVEGGAATLLVTPAGESILIDSGNPGGRDADRIYHVAKDVAGLTQIDHLIITHWHVDHYGGAAELVTKLPILEVHDKGIPESLPEDKEFTTRIQPYRDMLVKKRSQLQANQLINLESLPAKFSKLSLRVLGFDKKFIPITKSRTPGADCNVTDKPINTTDNANSTVLVLDYGPFRFFDGGDLTWNIEKTLVCPDNLVGTVDVYQVNHHGLDQSNNPALIKTLAPTVAIMNNGPRKGGGPETIQTLKGISSLQGNFQLHKNIRADSVYNTNSQFIANLKEKCEANFIKMTVEPNGEKYTISIPAKNYSKAFSTKINP
ncbi:ComEC/Rec2 family competence protein [Adhaeribacter radiodurans]|uniref:MBL fold metallo-hydrolase n=1 Tax=Adhaeribacter radiodurans TaxID=2745197 RepID=A0A7L7L554_9BACT|nr:MBL fold metallo-hydrolase [Adhaeribacter radiodurans]QMU27910.1 MBL fold metallo-hydrolase [Adhaeribacter radiodurans]